LRQKKIKRKLKNIRLPRLATMILMFIIAVLAVQVINTLVFYRNSYHEVIATRQKRMETALEITDDFMKQIFAASNELLRDGVSIEFSYRDRISSERNMKKIMMLMRTIDGMQYGVNDAYDFYVLFHGAKQGYSQGGLVSFDEGKNNYLHIQEIDLWETVLREESKTYLLPNMTAETSEGERKVHLVVANGAGASVIAVIPREEIDMRLRQAVIEQETVAILLDGNGNIIAQCGELELPKGCFMAEEYAAALNRGKYNKEFVFEYMEGASNAVVIGFASSTTIGGTIKLSWHMAISIIAAGAVIILVWIFFTRRVYKPIKDILVKIENDNNCPPKDKEKSAKNEFSLIDNSFGVLSSMVKNLSLQLEKHDEMYLENVLAKLATGVAERNDVESLDGHEYYIVTVVSESNDSTENVTVVTLVEEILRQTMYMKRFYHIGKQRSFFVETSEGNMEKLMIQLHERNLPEMTFIGVSRRHADLMELREALDESWEVFSLPQEQYDGENKKKCVIHPFCGNFKKAASSNLNMKELDALSNNTLRGESEAIERCLKNIFKNNIMLPIVQQRELHLYLLNLLFINRHDESGEEDEIKQKLEEIRHSYNIEFMHRAVSGCYMTVAEEMVPNEELFITIQNYVMENYGSDIYLQKIADEVGMSYSYISRYFKRKAGVGFADYVTGIRIRKAKELLVTTTLPVAVISKETGFDVIGSFNRSFKKQAGVTPGEYRKLHTEKESDE